MQTLSDALSNINFNELKDIDYDVNDVNDELINELDNNSKLIDKALSEVYNDDTTDNFTNNNLGENKINSNEWIETLSSLFNKQYEQNQKINQENLALKKQMYNAMTQATLGQLDIAKQQLGIQNQYLSLAKERWDYTKEELNRIKALRNKLTQQYLS